MTWSFNEIRPGEGVFDRWCRLFEQLLALGPVSLTQNGDRLRAFLDIVSTQGQPIGFVAGVPVLDVATWRTNCAMTMHAAQVWCGRHLAPYKNGESIEQYVELRRGDARWVPNDGTNAPREGGVAIFYVAPSAALPFDHVGGFGVRRLGGARVYDTYEGGGGDGTRIAKSSRDLDRPDAYGRRIAGWWEVADLLDPAEDPAPGPDGVKVEDEQLQELAVAAGSEALRELDVGHEGGDGAA